MNFMRFKALSSRFSSFSPVLIIFLAWFVLVVTNFRTGAHLTGWDNLHPEFDLGINLKRSIFAVWQEYQGVGLLGGMGHAADLVRQIALVPIAILLPDNMVRWFWTLLMLLVGALGAYKLTQILLPKNKTLSAWASTIAGLYYIFNLSTLQSFYIPFETFTSHFAALPWLLFAEIKVLRDSSKKNLAIFALVSLLASPSYYVPTLFIVTLIALGAVGIKSPLRFLKVLVLVFVTNAFWLLPFLYFTFTNGSVVPLAKINQMSTETIFLENKAFGTFQNVALLKGFWFDKIDPDKFGNFAFLMGVWRDYSKNILFLISGYLLFLIGLFGVFTSFKTKKSVNLSFSILFVFAFTMLMVATPPFSWVGELFRHSLPLFNQAFRFPFTKFSILTSLLYSLMIGVGVYWIVSRLKYRVVKIISIGGILVIILVYMFPVWKGNLFYKKEQIKIPQEYKETFEFFKKEDPNTRIANFPQQNFWSWNYYRWGYGGSGFLWYGINQPILDRAFDSWSNYNENYYWEISHALYSKDKGEIENVLEKYQINWILVDENIYSTTNQKSLYYEELKNLLVQSDKVSLSKEFDHIKVYHVTLKTPVNNFVFGANDLPNIQPSYSWGNKDTAFSQNGHYATEDSQYDSYYPFRSLFTGRNADENRPFEIHDAGDHFELSAPYPSSIAPTQPETQELVYVDPSSLKKVKFENPDVFVNNGQIQVNVPKVGGYFSSEISPNQDNVIAACDSEDKSQADQKIQDLDNHTVLKLKSKGVSCRLSVWLPQLQHNLSYIISIESKNEKGQPLAFWLENPVSRKADMEAYVSGKKGFQTSYFIQPPMEDDGLGYTIHIDNRSAGQDPTINDLGKITINPFPYNFLTQLSDIVNHKDSGFVSIATTHPNQAVYQVKLSEKPQMIVLSQAYNNGWKAYQGNFQFKIFNFQLERFFAPFLDKEIKGHVLVNNWENGWRTDGVGSDRVVIIYLPQYLEFLGFGILALGAAYFVVSLKSWNSRSSS